MFMDEDDRLPLLEEVESFISEDEIRIDSYEGMNTYIGSIDSQREKKR